MNNNEEFSYTYTAPTENERREIEDIRKQYLPDKPKEDKLTELRRLNSRVNLPPKIIAYIVGVVGLMLFGWGFAIVLEWQIYLWGTIICAVGAALMVANYFVYKAILKRNKKKYGQRILDLSDELLNENKK